MYRREPPRCTHQHLQRYPVSVPVPAALAGAAWLSAVSTLLEREREIERDSDGDGDGDGDDR